MTQQKQQPQSNGPFLLAATAFHAKRGHQKWIYVLTSNAIAEWISNRNETIYELNASCSDRAASGPLT